MYGIRNLLRINLLFVFFLIFLFSCKEKTTLVPEKTKQAFGFYAYELGDSLRVFRIVENKKDTLNFIMEYKIIDLGESIVCSFCDKDESIYMYFSDTPPQSIDFSISLYEEQDASLCIDLICTNHFILKQFYDNKEIESITYDSVYYYVDTAQSLSMYSSKNYGFIKIWNDTITYMFER